MLNPLDEKIADVIIQRGWLSAAQMEGLLQEVIVRSKTKKGYSLKKLVEDKHILSQDKYEELQKVIESLQNPPTTDTFLPKDSEELEVLGEDKLSSMILECPRCKHKFPSDDAEESSVQACPMCGFQIDLKKELDVTEFSRDAISAVGATPDFDSSSFIGRVIANCTIKKRLGQGGMGTVFLGVHNVLEQTRAIKVLPPNFAEQKEFSERFILEARTAAKLEHPNSVQVYDVGKDRKYFYIVMQYIDGGSLTKLIHNKGKLEAALALHIIHQIALGLVTAHREGIIHRDIKPDNILLTRDGQIKIADFGLAKDAAVNLTITRIGEIFGSPAYMSPEQCTGGRIDARSDMYSLGVTFYQIVTGERPFIGSTVLAVMLMHQTEKPRPPKELIPALSSSVENIIMKLLAKKPEDRYQSAKELLIDVQKAQKGIEAGKSIKIVKKTFSDNLFGMIAIQQGYMTPAEVGAVLRVQQVGRSKSRRKIPFGEVAVAEGFLSRDNLEKILLQQKNIQKEKAGIKTKDNLKDYISKFAFADESNRQKGIEIKISPEKEKEARNEFTFLKNEVAKLIKAGQQQKAIFMLEGFEARFKDTKAEKGAKDLKLEIVNVLSNRLARKGQELIHKTMLDEAITYLNTAIEINPEFSMAYNHRGIVYVRRKEWKKALANFSKAIELNSSQAIFYLNRGNVYRRLKRLDEAFNDYTRALKLDPKLDKAYCNRGGVFLSRKKFNEALENFEKALKINLKNEEAFNGRGKIFLKIGEPKKALSEFKKLCKLAPNNARAFNSLGEAFLVLNREDEAKQAFKRS